MWSTALKLYYCIALYGVNAYYVYSVRAFSSYYPSIGTLSLGIIGPGGIVSRQLGLWDGSVCEKSTSGERCVCIESVIHFWTGTGGFLMTMDDLVIDKKCPIAKLMLLLLLSEVYIKYEVRRQMEIRKGEPTSSICLGQGNRGRHLSFSWPRLVSCSPPWYLRPLF